MMLRVGYKDNARDGHGIGVQRSARDWKKVKGEGAEACKDHIRHMKPSIMDEKYQKDAV
jgi:hypothetical protein